MVHCYYYHIIIIIIIIIIILLSVGICVHALGIFLKLYFL